MLYIYTSKKKERRKIHQTTHAIDFKLKVNEKKKKAHGKKAKWSFIFIIMKTMKRKEKIFGGY
jgi:hypothetical protein